MRPQTADGALRRYVHEDDARDRRSFSTRTRPRTAKQRDKSKRKTTSTKVKGRWGYASGKIPRSVQSKHSRRYGRGVSAPSKRAPRVTALSARGGFQTSTASRATYRPKRSNSSREIRASQFHSTQRKCYTLKYLGVSKGEMGILSRRIEFPTSRSRQPRSQAVEHRTKYRLDPNVVSSALWQAASTSKRPATAPTGSLVGKTGMNSSLKEKSVHLLEGTAAPVSARQSEDNPDVVDPIDPSSIDTGQIPIPDLYDHWAIPNSRPPSRLSSVGAFDGPATGNQSSRAPVPQQVGGGRAHYDNPPAISSADDSGSLPYCVHGRVRGWKLTTPSRLWGSNKSRDWKRAKQKRGIVGSPFVQDSSAASSATAYGFVGADSEDRDAISAKYSTSSVAKGLENASRLHLRHTNAIVNSFDRLQRARLKSLKFRSGHNWDSPHPIIPANCTRDRRAISASAVSSHADLMSRANAVPTCSSYSASTGAAEIGDVRSHADAAQLLGDPSNEPFLQRLLQSNKSSNGRTGK